jgi:hypothetical protein
MVDASFNDTNCDVAVLRQSIYVIRSLGDDREQRKLRKHEYLCAMTSPTVPPPTMR